MNKKLIFILLTIFVVSLLLLGIFWRIRQDKQLAEVSVPAPKNFPLSYGEALAIAEKFCIKEGDSLFSGDYNENSKNWWFDAKINPAKEGCNPACVVSEETKQAEINWRCTGLIVPEESASDLLRALLAEKYPKYATTIVVRIDQEAESHVRGGVTMEKGAPGGIFLAVKKDGVWQIVFDGNGGISCDLSKYGFPAEMLSDCAK